MPKWLENNNLSFFLRIENLDYLHVTSNNVPKVCDLIKVHRNSFI